MAYVSIRGPINRGAVLVTDNVQEGRAVIMTASGSHRDLAGVTLAPAGSTNVFVVMATPDDFDRPTDPMRFQYNDTLIDPANPRQAVNYDIETRGYGFYNIGPSAMTNPVLHSGWKVQLHKGGEYVLESGCFVDSVGIKVNGAPIKVAASGQWTLASSNADSAVGYVEKFLGGRLYIRLDHKVG